ncbi:MAG: hypothetical protein NXI00_15620 [Cytophagales bacterium]|nr:hypothetical protein [Cytophagales bacterium]
MLKSTFLVLFTTTTVFMSSCTKEEECTVVCLENQILSADCNCVTQVVEPKDDEVKTGLLTSNETWTADRIYILQGKVVVDKGITLTIEPGTIIKGSKGVGSLAAALIVARGGKLIAKGTAEKPIVMTTIDDNIKLGEKFGSNLDETVNAQWGGLIILGNAPISAGSGATAQIEGIPADDTYGAYGGSDPADNSGEITYVSIRHGGALIGDGNEINGITLGGVGSGTVIEHVEVVGNLDDGIEFFGGTVNLKYGLVWAQGDDGYDIDQSYSGTIENSIYIAGADSDHALEIDGPENSINADGKFIFKNNSLKGKTGEYADWRSNAQGSLLDNYFFGFSDDADMELDDNAGVQANYLAGNIVISGNEFVLPAAVTSLASIFKDTFATGDDAKFKADMTAKNAAVTAKTKGADVAQFGWTFASHKGALTGF